MVDFGVDVDVGEVGGLNGYDVLKIVMIWLCCIF